MLNLDPQTFSELDINPIQMQDISSGLPIILKMLSLILFKVLIWEQ